MPGEEKVTFTGTAQPLTVDLQAKQMDLESGYLGRMFGNNANAPTNIAGVVALCLCICLCAVGVGHTITHGWDSGPFWTSVSPLLSLVLGFLFGKKA